jgi:hypothetical protein
VNTTMPPRDKRASFSVPDEEAHKAPHRAEPIRLSRGGTYIKTSIGAIQFGAPPETVKDAMLLGISVPTHFVVPRARFCVEIGANEGLNLAEIEFPAYFNFFVLKRKVNLICETADVEQLLRDMLQQVPTTYARSRALGLHRSPPRTPASTAVARYTQTRAMPPTHGVTADEGARCCWSDASVLPCRIATGRGGIPIRRGRYAGFTSHLQRAQCAQQAVRDGAARRLSFRLASWRTECRPTVLGFAAV